MIERLIDKIYERIDELKARGDIQGERALYDVLRMIDDVQEDQEEINAAIDKEISQDN